MDNIGDIIKNLSENDIKNLEKLAGEIFSEQGEKVNKDDSRCCENPFSDISPDVIAKVSSLMGMMNKSDSRCDLIEALKPNLSAARQKKADEAMQLIKLLDIIPYLENLK